MNRKGKTMEKKFVIILETQERKEIAVMADTFDLTKALIDFDKKLDKMYGVDKNSLKPYISKARVIPIYEYI